MPDTIPPEKVRITHGDGQQIELGTYYTAALHLLEHCSLRELQHLALRELRGIKSLVSEREIQ